MDNLRRGESDAMGDRRVRGLAVVVCVWLCATAVLAAADGCVPDPSQFPGKQISNLECEQIQVQLPFSLAFDGSQIGLPDRNGVSTGMRMVLPATSRSNYFSKSKIRVYSQYSVLAMQGTRGTFAGTNNRGQNAIGVALPLPQNAIRLETTVKMPDTPSTNRERFCMWLGVSDKEFTAFCVRRQSSGYELETYYEYVDAKVEYKASDVQLDTDRIITLRMDVYPGDSQIETSYAISGGAVQLLRLLEVNPVILNVDQAGTDPRIGSRTNAGVLAYTSNKDSETPVFYISKFEASEIELPQDTGTDSGVDFDTWRVEGVTEPTAMVWAGERLWITNVVGTVYGIEFNAERTQEVSRRELRPLGDRLVLGITADPNFDNNACLWLSHSSVSQSGGEANSGTITRLCGSDLDDRTDVIWGLPRAIANHATNAVWFDNNLLYIAVGSNTASGQPNTHEGFTFAQRPEQPLSAAILEADVFMANFNGNCTPSQDPVEMDATGIATRETPACDVHVYASGTRNPFSCVRHSNGKLYCPDNAIGGRGTFPTLADDYEFGDTCDGLITGTELETNDPGIREDPLLVIEQGKYYGHPNPSRLECVMDMGNPTDKNEGRIPAMPVTEGKGDRREVLAYPPGVLTDPNYQLPIASFGKNRSPDGIIEYKSNAMCGELQGQLLVTWFSTDPQVRRIKLDSDGTILDDGTLPGSSAAAGGITLDKPLPIEQDGSGNLFVGEFGSSSVAVFNPKRMQCR